MPDSPTSKRTPARVFAGALVLALVAVGLLAVAPSGAKPQKAKLVGATSKTPKPLCPKNCQGTGSVTGYQVSANGKKGLSKIPASGHIVGWSVQLSKPNSTQIEGFGNLFEDKKFGKDPIARLAILKSKKGKKKNRYKLVKQTPTVPMLEHLGGNPIITLNKPLKVRKGLIAALTMPTWAPLYTNRVSSADNSWRASRSSDDCGGSAKSVTGAKPQMRKGSTRTYGCKFNGERIIYWAYFVPSKGKSGKN